MTPLVRHQDAYLKREDHNITGSAKDRAVSLQVDHLIASGYKSATISSTGNAAISADYFCHKYNIPLTVFVSPKINRDKLKLIKYATIITTDKPISSAFKLSKQGHQYLLRQSTDIVAQTGYSQIATEILNELPNTTSIFLPVGSGTTLLGISKNLPNHIKLFAVQPASYCPIASHFDSEYVKENTTITDALSVKLLPLKENVLLAIKQSNGSGVVVQNSDVILSVDDLKNQNIITSTESALAYTGFQKAKKHFDIGSYPVIIFTGAKR